MKKLIIALFLFLCCSGMAGAAQPPSDTNQVQIIWAATNHWPSTVWVYKVVPQNFAPAVVSNLMAFGGFTMANRTNIEGRPPFKDQQLLFLSNQERTRYAGVFPPVGLMYYNDLKAQASGRQIATNVPSQEEVIQLGLENLQKLGIDRDQLAIKENSAELRTARNEQSSSWLDKIRGTNFEQTTSRGIFFIRRINGIDFDGITHGGVKIEFGNYGKVARLKVNWKGLEPYKLHNTLTAGQMVEAIHKGKASWWSPSPDPRQIKKITVTKATPLYRGILEEDEESKFLEPYVQLDTIVDYGQTNIAASLECPIIETSISMENH
ncbi:MAG: hypothetical protein WDM76_03970 [Limisphaerales bacterium]